MNERLDLVGPDEIARRLDVKPQTVAMWKLRGLLPAPIAVVSRISVWHWSTILDWARETGRVATPARPGEAAQAFRSTPEIREQARAEASRALSQLERVRGPMSTPRGRGGEWDWFGQLSAAEQARLRRRWMRARGLGPDQVAQSLASLLGMAEDDLEGAVAAWVDLTRRADMGRSVAAGRTPNPNAYVGLDAGQLFGVGDPEQHEASDTLPDCREGPTPADMTFEQWLLELEAVEVACAKLADAEWLGHDESRPFRRALELVPRGLGRVGSRREVYRRVVSTYRTVFTFGET